jgi:hypothetical protein
MKHQLQNCTGVARNAPNPLRAFVPSRLRAFRFLLSAFFILNFQFSILNSSAQPYTVYSCDFENWTDGKPDGWANRPDGTWNLNDGTPSPYTPAYSGNYACKITNGSPGVPASFRTTDRFPIYWGKKYVLSFVAKSVSTKESFIQELSISDTENDYFFRFFKRIDIGPEWQEYEIEFIPACRTQNTLSGWHLPVSTSGNIIYISIRNTGSYPWDVQFVIDNIKLVAKDHTMEFDYLDVNNLKAYIDPIVPFMHLDLPRFDMNYFEAPKNSGKSTIFATNLVLGGKDANGQLHVAAQTY